MRPADVVAEALAAFEEIAEVALIGSVAGPLRKEVPRFRAFARARIAIWHECKDLDLAVRIDALHRLGAIRCARDVALTRAALGVANHEVDVFLIDPGSDRYLGRLCDFATCPKGQPECRMPGCGAMPFNRVVEGFHPRRDLLAAAVPLYRRGTGRLRTARGLG